MLCSAFVMGLLWKRKPQGLQREPLRFLYAVRSHFGGTLPLGSAWGS